MLFVRPGELRKGAWNGFNLDKAEWHYLVTKTKTEHIVPLSSQAVTILRDLHKLTGHRHHVFPGGQDPRKPMSEAAINAALRRMGYDTRTEITGHPTIPVGFQSITCDVRLRAKEGTPADLLQKLTVAAERCCVVQQTLKSPPPVKTSFSF